LVRLAGGGEEVKQAVLQEFVQLLLGAVPAFFSDISDVLAEHKVQEDGSVQLQPAAYRNFGKGT
jgi:hypothetical protein